MSPKCLLYLEPCSGISSESSSSGYIPVTANGHLNPQQLHTLLMPPPDSLKCCSATKSWRVPGLGSWLFCLQPRVGISSRDSHISIPAPTSLWCSRGPWKRQNIHRVQRVIWVPTSNMEADFPHQTLVKGATCSNQNLTFCLPDPSPSLCLHRGCPRSSVQPPSPLAWTLTTGSHMVLPVSLPSPLVTHPFLVSLQHLSG